MRTENEIDQLFKRGLEEPDIPFNEMDWGKMERKLDENKKRRILPFWVFTASGIAAALLIFLFWFLLGPSAPQKATKSAATALKKKPSTEAGSTGPGADSIKPNRLGNNPNYDQLKPADPFVSNLTATDELRISLPDPIKISVPAAIPLHIKGAESTDIPLTDSAVIAQKAMALAMSKDPLEKISSTEIAKTVKRNMEDDMVSRPLLSLSAMAAPDISSGPSSTSRSSKVSTNLGLLATYALGSKFSLTSGAIYAKKYYNYDINPQADNVYTPPAGTDLEVKADCNVIDIPINVNYKILTKKRFSVSVSTGLSSYLMLKEKYDYVVSRADQPQQVRTTEFNNKNQHVFGIANVSVSIDHKLNDTFSLGVQPFTKLPLTGIGNYDVNLKSTGLSFSLSIGISSSKKTGKLASNRYSYLY